MAKKQAKKQVSGRIPPMPVPDEDLQDVADARLGEHPPEDVFFLNVLARMKAIGLASRESLADSLNLHGEDRKWLYRALNKGLKRPDHRRAQLLELLAEKLGCKVDDLWRADFDPDPMQSSVRQWRRLVHQTLNWSRLWELIKRHSPEEARDIVQKHGGDEEALLADWIAVENGARREEFNHSGLQELLADAFKRQIASDWELEFFAKFDDIQTTEPSTSYFVWERAKDHPEWPYFVEAHLGHDQEQFWHRFNCFLAPMMFRNPTPEEVWVQFKAHYLEKESREQEAWKDGLADILNRLHATPAWQSYVDSNFAGNIAAAEKKVADFWRTVVVQRGPNFVSPSKFVEFLLADE